MKKSLSGFDLVAITKELKVLVNSRIDKVYQPEKDRIVFSISSKEEGRPKLNVCPSGWIWLSKTLEEMPVSPTSFASQLRKHISNSRILKIEQHGLDRLIEIELQKEDSLRLIIELFADGNIILVGKDNNIIAIMKQRKWKQRELRIKGEYKYPQEAFDPRRDSKEILIGLIRKSEADIVRTLATQVNFGGEYSEEICRIAGIDKDLQASAIDDNNLEQIWKAILKLFDRLENNLNPNVSFSIKGYESVNPIELEIKEDGKKKNFKSFSEAIENFVEYLPAEEIKEKKTDNEKAKLGRTLATQIAASKRLSKEIEDAKDTAEHIFSKYERIQKQIDEVKDGLEKDELPAGIKITDKKTGLFEITVDKRRLILSLKKNARENAQAYFENAKRLKSKFDGANNAIEATQKRLKQIEKLEKDKSEVVEKKKRSSRREWYEHYRWFISSEGALVLGGKDAKSNEQLVKKHLQPGDRYVHADIHGAPSIVVKKCEGLTEATLEEAAIFSLAMSKAWNAGIASGSGYWVTPEQVSRTPQSGEFLAKGAFVIRGKRNYFEKLPVELAIGLCKASAVPKIMCGPLRAVEKNCDRYVRIQPGDLSKEKASKELAEKFSVDIDDVQTILPPGGLKIIE